MAAAAGDKFKKVGIATATTLSSPGYTIGDPSITVAATTNMPTDTGITVAIDVIDSSGVRVAGTYNEYECTVASATSLAGFAHVVGSGTNRNYSAGATTRVYIPVAANQVNDMVDGLLVSHNQDGTMITSLPLTTPKITTSINDANGNEVIKTPATTSAVNEATITNSATGNPVSITATGGDTNIDLDLGGKGTGAARHIGSYDGWVKANETLTYASATTFTCSAALAASLQIGDRIKLTQTTAKYFYVTGISGTTITVNGGTDYTLANAAITLPFYSHEVSPVGFPGSFAYTITWAGVTATYTSVNRFSVTGRKCTLDVKRSTNQTSNAGTLTATLPITAATITNAAWQGFGSRVVDNGSAVTTAGYAEVISAGTVVNLYINPQPTAWTASGAKGIDFQITYEI